MIGLTVDVIDSNDDLQELAPQWNALLDASRSGCVFLSWEWLSAWVECCLGDDGALFILAFREKGNLIGIAPFYIGRRKCGPFRVRELRFLGTPGTGSDYVDVFFQRGREKEVTNALYDVLMGERASDWDQLALSDVPADSLFLLHFMRRIQAEGKYAELEYNSYCPVASLRNSDGGFPLEISLGRKKKFRQDEHILKRDTDVVHISGRGEERGLTEDFFRFYETKWVSSLKKHRQLLCEFIEKHNGDCPVQIDLLSANGETVAGFLHLKYRDTLALYLMAVDKGFNHKISLGNVLVGLCLKNASAAGFATYDFLQGDESYKFHWATGGKSTMQLIFWQKRPAAVACALARLARNAGKLLLR
jgi:CelD/BcsL family acetyltransferase involved in cellulose biosynthesis